MNFRKHFIFFLGCVLFCLGLTFGALGVHLTLEELEETHPELFSTEIDQAS